MPTRLLLNIFHPNYSSKRNAVAQRLNDVGTAGQEWSVIWQFEPDSVKQRELPSLDP